MSEFSSDNGERDTPYPIDRDLVVGRLQEFGVEIEPEDLDDLADEEVITVVLTYVTMYDLDMDEILPQITPIESRTKDDN